MKIGYARCSTDRQDLTAQINELKTLGIDEAHIYTDPGFTGKNRRRPGLEKALAAANRPGDEFVVTKLDRLARSIRDFQDIADELRSKGVTLVLGKEAYDPDNALGDMMFKILAVFAEFERNLISQRTKEGMQVAKAKGRLQGKQPKLRPNQERRMVELFHAGGHTVGELAEDFGVSRATVYRAVERAGSPA